MMIYSYYKMVIGLMLIVRYDAHTHTQLGVDYWTFPSEDYSNNPKFIVSFIVPG